MNRSVWVACLFIAIGILAMPAEAQRRRITQPVDNTRRVRLRGEVPAKAAAENDRGRLAASREISRITLTLPPSEAQQADLDRLLVEQQTLGSPDYHRWLTPEEYAGRFGASEADVAQIRAWLEQQGLTVQSVARSRSWIAAAGPVARVEAAFQTEMHEYVVEGEAHFSNASEPSIPAALASVVGGVQGLNDFRPKPRKRTLHRPERSAAAPAFTTGSGNHYLAPNDIATIYNIAPLYAAGIDGEGQRVVIAGQTRIDMADVLRFRARFGLSAQEPEVIFVPGSRDPGFSENDIAEAHLDLEWSGAAARKATLLYVFAYNVLDAVQYAIDENLAPVISTSYGLCELQTSVSYAAAARNWARQANAQGITWLSASGDTGAADCARSGISGLAVDFPASIPEVTAVGGTQFDDAGGDYWNSTNDEHGGSARSYIPEAAWNDSELQGEPSATGGGASVRFGRPNWQVGTGVPSGNSRLVPDISMSASPSKAGYLVYTDGDLFVFGGTSVPTPIYAGVAALLNQHLTETGAQAAPGLGNINPKLYGLAQTDPDVFHDVTAGDNIVSMNCPPISPFCSSAPVGYSAGIGYDRATGLGSVDVYKMVTRWSTGGTVTPAPTTRLTLNANVAAVDAGGIVFLIATATGVGGITPTGTVFFSVNGTQLGSAALVGSAGSATATLAVSGAQLPQGSGTITAELTNTDAGTVTATMVVGVNATPSNATAPSVAGFANGASFGSTLAPGSILSIFGFDLAPSIASATSVPLPFTMGGVAVTINGVASPLYYVSPTQLNVQVPYEVPVGRSVIVRVNNNGQTTSQTLVLGAVAPGVFSANGQLVPANSAARGSVITLYLTGAGVTSPAVATGAAPPAGTSIPELPKPTSTITVQVGGQNATITFAGIPTGLVGVVQVNFQVPSSLTPGAHSVVVTIGGMASAPVSLLVTN